MTDQDVKTLKKKRISAKRIAILFVIICVGYFGLRHFEIKQAQKLKAKSEVGKYDNIESEIFDLAEDYKNGNLRDLSDIPLSELQEKGAEFFYKTLIKNQQQINELKEQTQNISKELTKYKSQEKLVKMIVAYVEFRDKLFRGEAYENSLKNFEMLSSFDNSLQERIAKLKISLKSFSYSEKLNADFDKLIPEIIAKKSSLVEGNFLSKVRHNISKLIVIRRIDGHNPNDVDAVIARTEKLLKEEKYSQSLEVILTLDQNYHEILVNFLNELNSAAEVQKIDGEILSYLKNLS